MVKNEIKSKFPLAKFCVINEDSNRYEILNSLQKRSLTKMFWVIDYGYEIEKDFKFDYSVPQWDESYVHVFENRTFKNFSGVYLIPKKYHITQKESQYMFFINKKEIPIVASFLKPFDMFFFIHDSDMVKNEIKSKFPLAKFCVINEDSNRYEILNSLQKRSLTKMFWVIDYGYEIEKDFKFDYSVPQWDESYVHVFENRTFKNFSGVYLIPKKYHITQKESQYMFFINKKEIPIVASFLKPFDIVFISYNEPNADENYQYLIERFPRAKRVHGVKGIHQAHKKAAEIATTPMFWAVDGDAIILENFNFNSDLINDLDIVYVWRSQNPINGLQYGYGGVKLLPTYLTKNLDVNSVDMTTSISSKFKAVPEISNISSFNTDEFNTWRSAFRECVKLSSRIIHGQNDEESLQRLETWCTKGENEKYGKFAIAGANQGKEFGFKYKNSQTMLSKINDWEWLKEEFQNYVGSKC